MLEENGVYLGDSLEIIKTIEDNSIDSVITSPPYYQLRDYGWTGQWGLEKTHQEYLDKMIALMAELKRILKPTGTMWINLGDTYASWRGKGGGSPDRIEREKTGQNKTSVKFVIDRPNKNDSLEKSLLLIPHRFAIRCVDELGLKLRNDIIWAKPNGMPESVTDRFSKKHEFIFFFVKQQKYYFDLDAIRDEHKYPEEAQKPKRIGDKYAIFKQSKIQRTHSHPLGKNPGDVSDFWAITTKPNSAKHYATFNSELIDKPIKAGCPEGGIILDPFAGTATTGVRAIQLGRKFIGIDGSKDYVEIAKKRIDNELKQQNLFRS